MQNYANVAGNRKRSNEMKRELSDMGMYEDGMSTDEMQQLLSVINESKGQAEMQRDDSGMQIESPTAVEPPFPERSSSKLTKRTTHDSASPDHQPNVFSNRNKDRKKSTEDDIFTESVRSSDTPEAAAKPYVPTPSPPRALANNAPTPQENHKNVTTRKIQPKLFQPPKNMEKWRMDPFDCKKDDDPPLRARSNGGKAPPIRVIEIDEVPQIPEDIRQFISNHLTEVSRNHFIRNKEDYEEPIQWGAPIKVGIANGSLDKNPRRERSQTPSTSQEMNDAGVALRAVQVEENRGRGEKSGDGDVYAFGDEDDADFQTSRKRPRTAKLIGALPERPPLMRKARMKTIALDIPQEEEEEVANLKDPEWAESSRGAASRKRPLKSREPTPDVQKKREQSPEYDFEIRGKQKSNLSDFLPSPVSETSSPNEAFSPPSYPRRVVPPNPSRPKSRGGGKRQEAAKAIKNLPELSISRIQPSKKKKEPGLSEDEIKKKLESDLMTDDEDDDTNQIFVPEKTSKRTENALALLSNANEQEQEDENRKKAAEKARKAREERERHERVQKKIRDETARMRATEALEKMDKEKTERWNSGMKTRNSGRRTELDGEQSRQQKNIFEWDANNSSGDIEEVQVVRDEPKTPGKVQCPCCGKWFPEKEVENHAANCSDFPERGDEVEEVVERTPNTSDMMNCQVCGRYRTKDGNELQDHMTNCIAEKERASRSQADVIPIPDSPPRAYQSISSLGNSEIYNEHRNLTRRASPRGGDRSKRKRLN